MEVFKRVMKVGNYFRKVDVYVYTIQEAKQKGIEYLLWKNVPLGYTGYVATDDGYVVQCQDVRLYTNHKKRSRMYVKTTVGAAFVDKSSKILYEERRLNRDYSNINSQLWIDRKAKSIRTQRAVRLYVQMMFNSPKKIDFELLGKTIDPTAKIPEATAKRLLKQEVIKDMVKEEVKKELQKLGITEEFVLKKHLKAAEIAETTEDATALLKVADRLADYLEMKPEKNKKPDGEGDGDFWKYVSTSMADEDRRIENAQVTMIGDGEENADNL